MCRVLILLFLVSASLRAQETVDHSFVVGGNISFVAQTNSPPFIRSLNGAGGPILFNSSEVEVRQFSANVYAGKQLDPAWLLGLTVQAGNLRTEQEAVLTFPGPVSLVTRTNNAFAIGVFARYNFTPNKPLGVFLQPEFSYNLSTSNVDITGSSVPDLRTTYADARVRAGLLYDLSDRFRLTLNAGGLSYISGKSEQNGQSTAEDEFSVFRTDLSLSGLRLGAEFRF